MKLIFPKLDEEREIALAVGEFKETSATKDSDAATDANDVMDGCCHPIEETQESE